jgi:hypothetical protein
MLPSLKRVYNANSIETYVTTFLTAVATTGVDIDLPPGWYEEINVYGYQTNSSTAATLSGYIYTKGDKSVQAAFFGNTADTAGTVDTAIVMGTTDDFRAYFTGHDTATTGSAISPVYLPYGIKMVFTANGASAINLALAARKVG